MSSLGLPRLCLCRGYLLPLLDHGRQVGDLPSWLSLLAADAVLFVEIRCNPFEVGARGALGVGAAHLPDVDWQSCSRLGESLSAPFNEGHAEAVASRQLDGLGVLPSLGQRVLENAVAVAGHNAIVARSGITPSGRPGMEIW